MNDSTTKGGAENEKLSTALNEILSNPQMLSMISSMAQGLKNSNGADTVSPSASQNTPQESESVKEQSAMSDKLPELLNMLSSDKGSNAKQSQRSELLCALKPYLSQSRSDAIDKIIRFSELSSVFKRLT